MTAVTPLPAPLAMPGSDTDLLRREYLHIVTKAIDGHARSQQKALGPSEVGQPCARRLGYQLLDYDERGDLEPNWKATVGTALHTWLEAAFAADDAYWSRSGLDQRWVLEETLFCGLINGQALVGHCDLYDRVTYTVLDHKSVGPSQLKKYKAQGPGEQYRIQAHIYGRGWQLRGLPVERVAIMFLPRQGELREAHWWSEPYDEQIALDAIARVDGIARTTTALGDAALPLLPTAASYCTLCPYFKRGSTDLTRGCPGDPAVSNSADSSSFADLLG